MQTYLVSINYRTTRTCNTWRGRVKAENVNSAYERGVEIVRRKHGCKNFRIDGGNVDETPHNLGREIAADETAREATNNATERYLALPESGRPFWAIAFHSDSRAPRAKHWYRVSRMIQADNDVFELYWHPDIGLRGNSLATIRQRARDAGINLAPGVYCDAVGPRDGSVMVRSI
jgi:hypothetical protein